MRKRLSILYLFLLITILLLIINVSYAQGIHSLPFTTPVDSAIGKPCPEVELAHIVNFPETHAKISDFRGKILIIDFYTTNCRGCVLSFPKYDSLQKVFGDKIQVLLCTGEPEESVRNLFNRFEGLRKLHLASIVSDTVLQNIFYHRTVPHVILIDQKGTVRAITSEIDRKDIKSLLAGRSIHLPVKKDATFIDYEAPQIISDYQYYNYQNHFYFNSYIAPYTSATGPMGSLEKDKRGNITRIKTFGTIQWLYRTAYGKENYFNTSRVMLNFKDSSSFKKVNYNKGINCYIYDMVLNPGWSVEKVYKYMQYQLDLFFDVKSSEEKRIVECWVLKRTDSSHYQLVSKGGKGHAEMVGKILEIKNGAWWNVIRGINGAMAIPPVQIVDSTGIDAYTKVDIDINTDFSDFEAVRKSLLPYGLSLSAEQIPLNVIVLEDR